MKKERNSTDRTTLLKQIKKYGELGKSQVNVERPPSKEEAGSFWEGL